MNYMNVKTRKEVVYAKVGSIILYGAAAYSGQSERIKKLFNTLLMRCNSTILDRNVFHIEHKLICRDIKVQEPEELINQAAAKLINKVIHKKKPREIYNLLRFQLHQRNAQNLSLTISFRTIRGRRNTLSRSVQMFNALPPQMRNLPPQKFNHSINNYSLKNNVI